MALISKISRLGRIPQLLNKKRDAERDANQQRERSSDQPVFTLNGYSTAKRPETAKTQRTKAESFNLQTAKSLREGIGRRVDVFV